MVTAREKINEVKMVYEEIAKDFSDTRGYIWPELKPFIKKVGSKESLLDVGCGNGRLLLGLPKTIKYTGLDISPKLLEEAQKKYPNNNFIETDITKPEIWKHLGEFDHIFCVALMHHLPDKESQLFVLKQIKAHLKPKSSLLVTVWNLWQKKYIKYHVDPATKWQNPYWVNIPFKGKKRFCFAYTKPYLESLLKEAKLPLKIKKTEGNYLLYK
ncbi:MAG: hypothetical protein UW35_C0028G0021 [Candidatus Collierbacteria bacterium GW2011_GWF2_44_15]|uniref:Methyltransferase domain-containing protein n=3 Tax=Candidatus Collieribacteriota TaxID=1752725 RepID=A0A0G1JPJ7_9BACT|nr:MAG: hypothetical protein UW35_C0028G0021 [Candidatus Collierbacteria bacterium GW2011_GWF2_44_15]